ncbi:MAG: efflux RND transporter periplasmic adaptor subunit [Pseudomonadota bacterium]
MRAVLILSALSVAAFFTWQQFTGDTSAGGRQSRPPAPVTLVTVDTYPYQDTIPALGTLQAWESIDITASVSQLVASIQFEDGQRVTRGETLATLRQEAEQSTLRELRARLKDAQREVTRLADLARRNQVAQTDLDSANTEVEVIRHQISEVSARIADRTIVAPFDGVLGLREVSEGALVETGQRLTTLDDISKMRLQFSVPARYLAMLKPGMPVSATTAAFPGEFSGEITAVDSRIDPVARSVTARAVLPNEDGRLRPGLLMELVLAGDATEVLMVPEESVQSRAARHYVWEVSGDLATRREVLIRDRRPGWVIIAEGVSPGQEIVKDGLVRLSGNSAAVRVVSS